MAEKLFTNGKKIAQIVKLTHSSLCLISKIKIMIITTKKIKQLLFYTSIHESCLLATIYIFFYQIYNYLKYYCTNSYWYTDKLNYVDKKKECLKKKV